MCLSMLHEVGHFLELNVGAGNILWRKKRMCLGLKRLLWCPKDYMSV